MASAAAMETVYDGLETQRLSAIKAFWLAALVSVLLLPLAALPLAGSMIVMVDHPPDTALAALANPAKALLEPYIQPVLLGASLWFFVGLYLAGRYFVRYGRQPVWDYIRSCKAVVLNHICTLHFPGLRYDPKGYVGYDEFDATNLFAHASDVYRSEDFFSGQSGKTDIHFAEVVAERERKRFSKGSFETYYEEFFNGLVFVADFHKHFHSNTRLIPRGEKLKKVRGEQPVTMEDPEFEEIFATVSTDQVDARYVLSTAMIRRFVDLNKRFPGMRALFRDEKLVLALPGNRDLFEPSLYRRARSSAQISEFVEDIKSLLQIVDEMNLNTRIWSKA